VEVDQGEVAEYQPEDCLEVTFAGCYGMQQAEQLVNGVYGIYAGDCTGALEQRPSTTLWLGTTCTRYNRVTDGISVQLQLRHLSGRHDRRREGCDDFQALRKTMKRKTKKGVGITILNNRMYSQGWRPLLPLEFKRSFP